jgi:hypothetical protein
LFQRTDRASELLEGLRDQIRQIQLADKDHGKLFSDKYQEIVQMALMWSITTNLVPLVQLFLPEVRMSPNDLLETRLLNINQL